MSTEERVLQYTKIFLGLIGLTLFAIYLFK